jgi:hypothetical protein
MMFDENYRLNRSALIGEQQREAMRREIQRSRLARQALSPAQQRRRFFLMYRIRNLLFRISGTLAHKLVM